MRRSRLFQRKCPGMVYILFKTIADFLLLNMSLFGTVISRTQDTAEQHLEK